MVPPDVREVYMVRPKYWRLRILDLYRTWCFGMRVLRCESILPAACTCLLIGCSAFSGLEELMVRQPLTGLPQAPVRIGDDLLTAEVPQTYDEQLVGLKYRRPEDFPADRAMLFIIVPPRSVWMVNSDVLFDIDVAFVRPDQTIARMVTLKAGDPTPYGGGEVVGWVLEVGGGQLAQRGITVGDTLEFPDQTE